MRKFRGFDLEKFGFWMALKSWVNSVLETVLWDIGIHDP